MWSKVLSLSVAALLAACGADGPTTPNPIDVGVAGDGGLDAVLDTLRRAMALPALGAITIEGEQVVESGAVGFRASGESVGVTAGDLWHLGSLTKAMTATLAAQFVEDGDVEWSTTIADAFPDLVGSIRPEFESVRLDELLYHTGGLSNSINQTASWGALRTSTDPLPEQRREWVVELLSLTPAVARGTHYYSNAGYIVAGAMLEEISGQPWETLMTDRIFTPLGMTSGGFGPPGQTGPGIEEPRGHVRQGSSWVPLEPDVNADNPAALGPAGTVHATMEDYARFVAEHLAGARGVGTLVTSDSYDKLHTPAPGTAYSLGWGVSTRAWANGLTLAHAGSNTFWYAVVWVAPERNLAMIAVTNVGGQVAEQATDLAIQAMLERFENARTASAAVMAGG